MIPFSKFFRGNINLIKVMQEYWAKARGRSIADDPDPGAATIEIKRGGSFEPIPVPALLLHCFFTWFLILTTLKIEEPRMAYEPLVGVYSYTIDAMVSFTLAVGIIYMRWSSTSSWNRISAISSRGLSIAIAIIVLLSNGFPIFALWNPKGLTNATIPFFVVPTVGWALLVSGLLYWVLFRSTINFRQKKGGRRFVVRRNPILYVDEDEWLCIAESNEQAWLILSDILGEDEQDGHELEEYRRR